jgi:hypothetical protein
MSRAARFRALLERVDAALVSLAAIVWSELLCALALAGECAAGARSFPPDLLDEDGNPSRRSSAELTELLSDR